jgi:hypothetical protein
MNISSIGSLAGMPSLFDSASAGVDDSGASSPPSGSDSSSSPDVDVAAAQYGFDGRVLAMQRDAVSQLFSALA